MKRLPKCHQLLLSLLLLLSVWKAPAQTPTPNTPEISTNHVIMVDQYGRLHRPDGSHRLIKSEKECNEYLENIVYQITNRPSPAGILLYIHGGLNPWSEGLQHFVATSTNVSASGYYPIYVVWPSGLKASYLEHLFRVRQGVTVSPVFGALTSPLILAADFGTAIVRAPSVWINLIKSDYSTTYFIGSRRKGKRDDARTHLDEMMKTNFPISIGYDYRTRWDMTGRFAAYLLTLPAKLIDSPIIDALGKNAWDNMLRRTENIYPSQYIEAGSGPLTNRAHSLPKSVLTHTPVLPLFMHKLEEVEESRRPQITLVAHSAGTIILNRLIRDSSLTFSNVVYMGSAATIQDFHLQVLDYLQAHPKTKFYNLCLHPVAETREWNAFDLPPRGSLLEWIDNFLSNPVNNDDRTLGKWNNLFSVDRQRRFEIDELLRGMTNGGQMNFKAFNVGQGTLARKPYDEFQWTDVDPPSDPKWKPGPQKHGDFSGAEFWNPKFWDPAVQ